MALKAISAQRSSNCTRIIMSTDNTEIQEEAKIHGVGIPFTRPSELATDRASSADVIVHAMNWINARKH